MRAKPKPKFQAGQVWAIARGLYPDDPLLITVLGIESDVYVNYRTALHSAPTVELYRNIGHFRDFPDGRLISGPGSPWPQEQLSGVGLSEPVR